MAVLIAGLVSAGPVIAGPIGEIETGPTDIKVWSTSHSDSPQAVTSSAPVYRDCVDVALTLSTVITGISDWLDTPLSIVTAAAPIAYRSCTRISDAQVVGWVTGLPADPAVAVAPTAQDLVAQAQASLTIDLPDVATSPPRGGIQLAGVPVWFWVDNWAATSVTAAIPGLSATLTATPTSTVVHPGDDTTVTCDGPGVKYDPTRSYKDQHSTCSHPYDRDGRYRAAVTVTWSLTWAATDGQTGVLPAVARTTTIPLTVQQGQAVTD